MTTIVNLPIREYPEFAALRFADGNPCDLAFSVRASGNRALKRTTSGVGPDPLQFTDGIHHRAAWICRRRLKASVPAVTQDPSLID